MLEGTVANIPPQGGRKHPEQQYIQLDTTHILFICAGTFVGIDEIIKRRIGRKNIGFASETERDDRIKQYSEVIHQVTPEDLITYGMIPEFAGRLPVITALNPLDVDALIQILTEPKNALAKQYQRFFELEDCHLEFSTEALKLLAERAIERDTGARALRAVMEEIMLDPMYDLPDQKEPATYVVTEEVINGEVALLKNKARRRKESA